MPMPLSYLLSALCFRLSASQVSGLLQLVGVVQPTTEAGCGYGHWNRYTVYMLNTPYNPSREGTA
jgi:hypothetical protein